MKRSTKLNKIKKNLINSSEIGTTILELKSGFDYFEYQQCLKILFSNILYKKQLLYVINVRNYSDLIQEGLFPMFIEKNKISNIKLNIKEFEFWAAYLANFSKHLQKFNDLRDLFEYSILHGNYPQADEILETIEKKFGKSFWYIETKMLLLQIWKKKEDFYTFYKDAKNKSEHEIIKSYIRMIQRKVNFHITNNDYKKFCMGRIKELSEKYPVEQEMLTYINFMTFYDMEDISSNEGYVLQHLLIISQHLSLIDQYILFSNMVLNLRIQSKKDNMDEMMTIFCAENDLRKKLDLLTYFDNRSEDEWNINSLVNYINKYVDKELEVSEKQLFLDGKYQECIRKCRNALQENIQFDKILLLVQSYVASNEDIQSLPEKVMIDRLVKLMCKMYVKSPDNISEINTWEALPRIFMSCSFNMELVDFVYNRLYAISEFNAVKTLYAKLYSKKSIVIEHTMLLSSENAKKFLYAWKIALGKCIVCNWLENIWQFFRRQMNIYWDLVSMQLFQFLEKEKDIQKFELNQLLKTEKNIEVFLREEFGVYIFTKAVEYKEYKVAFEIYTNMYLASNFSTMRMSEKDLNKHLHLGNCRAFYGDLNFVVYACEAQLHYVKKDLPSEYIRNCFRQILRNNGVNKPSLLEMPKDGLKSLKMAYFLFNVCDLKMLNIIDLYDLEAIIERKKILELVHDKYDCSGQLRDLNEQEIRINMVLSETESMQVKAICANWLKIANNSSINNAMQQINEHLLNNYNYEYINMNWQYNLLRDLIIKDKGLYIDAVNDKLGTTIRHCILERIMLENLTNYKVYFKNIEDAQISLLERYEGFERKFVLNNISIFFDNFFLVMDAVRKRVYFTEHEDGERVKFFVPDNIIKKEAKNL